MARKRLPKKSTLTAAEKAERDARAQHWMNQRKIERVVEAAARSGWSTMPADDVIDMCKLGKIRGDEEGRRYIYQDTAVYRIEKYTALSDTFTLRKIR